MPRRSTRATFEPPVYTFRVRILGGFYAPENGREIVREIEVAANQSLGDLAETIQAAYGFDDPHLWAFFLSGKRWDEATEYGISTPYEHAPHDAYRTLIRDVPFPGKTGKQEFLWLFDFGDGWEFGVKLIRISPELDPAARYPRIVASQGEAPPQYPMLEDDAWGDEDWEGEADANDASSPASEAEPPQRR